MIRAGSSLVELQEMGESPPEMPSMDLRRRSTIESFAPMMTADTDPRSEAAAEDTGRQCTICFGDEYESPNEAWCKPCRCRGTSQWVHTVCILRWIDEKQKHKGLDATVRCEQCQYPYRIKLPHPSVFEQLKAIAVDTLHAVSPFAVFGIACLGIFHLSYKLGVIYMNFAAGVEVTEQLLSEASSRPVARMALTVTPMALLGFGLIRWDDLIVKAARWSWQHIASIASRLAGPKDGRLPSLVDGEHNEAAATSSDPPIPEVQANAEYSDWITSSLALPFVSALCGTALFSGRPWALWQKTAAGGLTFLVASTTLNIYCNLRSAQRRKSRSIIDFGA